MARRSTSRCCPDSFLPLLRERSLPGPPPLPGPLPLGERSPPWLLPAGPPPGLVAPSPIMSATIGTVPRGADLRPVGSAVGPAYRT
jgi:hypothetical protein